MFREWAAPDSQIWFGLRRALNGARPTEAERRYARRNIMKFSGGAFRRFELPYSHSPYTMHYLYCDECYPNEAQKDPWINQFFHASSCDLWVLGR
eukprot:9118390-Pyramimonas_sp.AAC.1